MACKPLATYFDLQNTDSHPSRTNDEGLIDIKFSHSAWGLPFQLYVQAMNEDTNPFWHSKSSHLIGTTVWLPLVSRNLRLTVEYTNTIATLNLFGFHYAYGETYNDYKYPHDGMRFDGRALGFSLDSDSRLLSLQAAYVDSADRSYMLTLHHADISTPQTGQANPLTTSPVTINILEGRLRVPIAGASVDFAARLQDDQLRPKRGFTGALETAIRVFTD